MDHPYAVGALLSAFTFLLAFRANFSYHRWWEAMTAVHTMHSKWLDVGTELAAFHLQAAVYRDQLPPSFGAHPELTCLVERERERLNVTTLEELEVKLDEDAEKEKEKKQHLRRRKRFWKRKNKKNGGSAVGEDEAAAESNAGVNISVLSPLSNVSSPENQNTTPAARQQLQPPPQQKTAAPSTLATFNIKTATTPTKISRNFKSKIKSEQKQRTREEKQRQFASQQRYRRTAPVKSINAPAAPYTSSSFMSPNTHHSNYFRFPFFTTSLTTVQHQQQPLLHFGQAATLKTDTHDARKRPWQADTPPLFLQEAAHLLSLLSAVALSTLRNDLEKAESPLIAFTPGAPWPHVDPDDYGADVRSDWEESFPFTPMIVAHYLLGWSRTPKMRTLYNAARPLRVIGGVSDGEVEVLQAARGPLAKVALVTLWLQEFITREHLAGSTGMVSPPIISRLYQCTSDGMMGYNHARKVAYIPFPFPHAQITSLFVLIVGCILPVLMQSYLTNEIFGFSMNLLTVMCFCGLHEVARELENPFQNAPNDIPVNFFQSEFNEALITMFFGCHPDAYWQVVEKKEKEETIEASLVNDSVDDDDLEDLVEHDENGTNVSPEIVLTPSNNLIPEEDEADIRSEMENMSKDMIASTMELPPMEQSGELEGDNMNSGDSIGLDMDGDDDMVVALTGEKKPDDYSPV